MLGPPLNPSLASSAPIPEDFARGVVFATHRDSATYDVKLSSGPDTVLGCRWACGGIFAPLFGYRVNGLLEEGTQVIVMRGNPPYIVHALPSGRPVSRAQARARGVGDGSDAAANLEATGSAADFGGTNTPKDLVEGEFSIENALGSGVDFLLNVVRLRAGRAFLEACLLDDSLRLVSENFSQHTALGDVLHKDDGRLNGYEAFTSYEHEAWGKLTPEEAKARMKAGGLEAPTEEELRSTGRWRFERFTGFLGDFIHEWITSPESVLGNLATQGTRSANSRHWRGADGSLLWQSVGEIALERVVRINVPQYIGGTAGVDEPTTANFYTGLERQFLQIWDRGIDQKNTHQTAFQIRQYSRWLSQFVAYARFHQQPTRWRVPKESETPAPETTAGESDKQAANGGAVQPYLTYATIRILRDGGIMALEGSGAALLISGGRAWLTAPFDLNLEAGGDIRMTAGRDVWIKGRRNVTITSVVGAFAAKARTSWRALCEMGSVWLKSDATEPTETPTGTPNNPAVEFAGAGVVIEAIRSGARISSAGQTLVESTGAGDVVAEAPAKPGGVVLQASKGQVYMRAARSIVADASTAIELRGVSDLLIRCSRLVGYIRSGMFLPSIMHATRSGISIDGVFAGRAAVCSNGFNGPAEHVGTGGGLTPPDISTPDEPDEESVIPPLAHTLTLSTRPVWKYPPVRIPTSQPIMESLSQQHARLETPHAADPTAPAFGVWDHTSDTLRPAPGTDATSLPYPGKGKHLVAGGDSLRAPSDKLPNAMPSPQALTAASITTRYVTDAA